MGRYRNADEILADLENRQGVSGSYSSSADLSLVPQSLTSGCSGVSIHSAHDFPLTRPDEWDSQSLKSNTRGDKFWGIDPSQFPHRPINSAILEALEPPKPRVVPWSATDWVSSESGYSCSDAAFVENRSQARQVLGAAEAWGSRCDGYSHNVPMYSTHSSTWRAIDWVSRLKLFSYILGIIAILGYVACYFALR